MTSVYPPPGVRPPGPPSHGGPALPGRRPRGRGGWRPWTVWVALVSGFATTIVVSIIVGLVAAAAGVDVGSSPPGIDIVLTIFQNVALFGAAYLFARMLSKPRGEDFGLRRPPKFWLMVGVLFAVWISFYLFAAIWSTALGLHEDSELPERLGVDNSTVNLVAVTFLVTVVAPIGEELFFRGYFFGALRNWRGVWPAAIIAGLVFGAIHLGSAPVGQLVPLAVFGMGLCLLYHWSGSLYPCIVLHAFNNSIAFGAGEDWAVGIIFAVMAGSALVAVMIAWGIGRVLDITGRSSPRAALSQTT